MANFELVGLCENSLCLKRVSSTRGGEWHGPCPLCSGKDRFIAQPNYKKGFFWCRKCGASGSLAALGFSPSSAAKHHERSVRMRFDASKWRARAKPLYLEFYRNLRDYFPEIKSQLEMERGICLNGMSSVFLGYNPKDLFIPAESLGFPGADGPVYIPKGIAIFDFNDDPEDGVKKIKIRQEGNRSPKYLCVKGSSQSLQYFGAIRPEIAYVVVEDEFGAIAAANLMDGADFDRKYTFVSLGGSAVKPSSFDLKKLRGGKCLLILDQDEAGRKATQELKKLIPNAFVGHTDAKSLGDQIACNRWDTKEFERFLNVWLT